MSQNVAQTAQILNLANAAWCLSCLKSRIEIIYTQLPVDKILTAR